MYPIENYDDADVLSEMKGSLDDTDADHDYSYELGRYQQPAKN